MNTYTLQMNNNTHRTIKNKTLKNIKVVAKLSGGVIYLGRNMFHTYGQIKFKEIK